MDLVAPLSLGYLLHFLGWELQARMDFYIFFVLWSGVYKTGLGEFYGWLAALASEQVDVTLQARLVVETSVGGWRWIPSPSACVYDCK